MNNESVYARKFSPLIKRIRQAHPAPEQDPRDPVDQLVIGFLQWNTTSGQALAAYERLMGRVVDCNDLRVCQAHEVVGILGEEYPLARERAQRLHEVLQAVFLREHGMTLDKLSGWAKKQVRAYMDILPGMTPYVAAQVTLLCFGGHAIPVDDVLAQRLRGEGVVDPEAGVEEIESFLQRQVKAVDAPQTHGALRAWVDVDVDRSAPRKKASGKKGRSASGAKASGVKKTKAARRESVKQERSTGATRRASGKKK